MAFFQPRFAFAQDAQQGVQEAPTVVEAQSAPSGWAGRHMPNLGLLVTRGAQRDGTGDVTAIGFEATYTWLLTSIVQPSAPTTPTAFERGWRGLAQRVTTIGVGPFAQLEFAHFTGEGDVQPRVALGVQGGGFIGAEVGAFYRGPGNGYAGTFGLQIAPYISLSAFSFAVRLPVFSTRADSSSDPIFNEGFTLSVKVAPLHVLALIFDWHNFLNPEYQP